LLKVRDEELKNAESFYEKSSPSTKEALYYRRTFEKNFGRKHEHLTPFMWTGKWTQPLCYVLIKEIAVNLIKQD